MSQLLAAPSRIFVIDEHPVVLSCLTGLISRERDLLVCGTKSTLGDAAETIARAQADLVVIDIGIGHIGGLELVGRIRNATPRTRIVCYSVLDEAVFAERALRAGASAYVMKTADYPVLLQAIRCVLGGGMFLSEAMRGRMLERLAGDRHCVHAAGFHALSDRELQVIYHLGEKRSEEEIARRLPATRRKVAAHRARIMAKLGMGSLGELMGFASRWIEADAGMVAPTG